MVVMELIVRHQDRGTVRLDHLHNADERALHLAARPAAGAIGITGQTLYIDAAGHG
jgi:hypothetical protein